MRSERRGTERGLVARLGGSREVVRLDFRGGGEIRRRGRRRRRGEKGDGRDGRKGVWRYCSPEATGRGKGVAALLVYRSW
ncbi:hypothetical protein HAX54_052293, partial [Datura stramonium]|nr:hypothetical protein [Datura stramonium]